MKVFDTSIRKSLYINNITFILGTACNKIRELHNDRKKRFLKSTPLRTALDDLASLQRKNLLDEVPTGFNKEDIAQSDEDIEDLVFQRSILPERTGVFDVDFPESPKISKNKGGKGKVKKSLILQNVTKPTTSNEEHTVTANLSKSPQKGASSESELTSDDLDINGNIRPSGVSSHTKADENSNTSETDQVEDNVPDSTVKSNDGGIELY